MGTGAERLNGPNDPGPGLKDASNAQVRELLF